MTEGVRKAAGRFVAGAAMLLSMTGCALLQPNGAKPEASLASSVARPADPMAQFAGRANPGVAENVTLASGQTVVARMVRGYSAASGRECREVQYGALAEGRSAIFCQDGQTWVAARPLLRGGAVARP